MMYSEKIAVSSGKTIKNTEISCVGKMQNFEYLNWCYI
jgi:hypothetical protein